MLPLRHQHQLSERADDIGYRRWIGCEYGPISTTESGLEWVRSYLTQEPGLNRYLASILGAVYGRSVLSRRDRNVPVPARDRDLLGTMHLRGERGSGWDLGSLHSGTERTPYIHLTMTRRTCIPPKLHKVAPSSQMN